jgi:myo-inositol 2-dehydrogenase/D-chiro-inositol 1-dehydrogenase
MSMSQPVYRVVVVGMGKRGMHHATTFHANPRFQVVGVCDIDAARKLQLPRPAGVNPKPAPMRRSWPAKTRPDVFCLHHAPHALSDDEAGGEARRAVIAYEKPMALDQRRSMANHAAAAQAGVKAVVSHQHRYGAHYQKVKEIIASGALGRIHTVYGRRPAGCCT